MRYFSPWGRALKSKQLFPALPKKQKAPVDCRLVPVPYPLESPLPVTNLKVWGTLFRVAQACQFRIPAGKTEENIQDLTPDPMDVLLLLQGHHSLFIYRPHLVPADLPAWDYPYSSLRQIGQEVGLIFP